MLYVLASTLEKNYKKNKNTKQIPNKKKKKKHLFLKTFMVYG